MKKNRISFMAFVLLLSMLILPSCATILGGQVSTCQKTKPNMGQPQRAVRVAALVADILIFWPGAIIDFATGAIYKPCTTNSRNLNKL